MFTVKDVLDGMEVLVSWTKRFQNNAEDNSLSPEMVDIILEEAGQELMDNARIGELYAIVDRIRGYSILVDVDAVGLDLRVTLISARISNKADRRATHTITLTNGGVQYV